MSMWVLLAGVALAAVVHGEPSSAVAALRQNATRPHPWLFAVPDEVDPRLRRSILRAAEGHLDQPPVERKFDESGRRLLQQAEKVRTRVITLASAWRLTGDGKYAAAAERELLAMADWETWNPEHWLDTAVLLETAAIGCDWLWDLLAPITREKLARTSVEKGLKTIRASSKNDFWRRGNTNWNTTCWYGATLASIVFHNFAPELAESLVLEAIAAFPRPVEFLAPEGAYPEGPSYWGSIVGYLYAIDALESALGSDFGLASVKGLRETAFYRSWMDGPSGYLFNYSDAGWGTPYMKRAFASPSLWFAKHFGFHAQAAKDRAEIERRLEESDRTGTVAKLGGFPLVMAGWGLKAPPGACEEENSPALDWYSGGSQPLVVMRSGTDRESAYVGIKGGQSAASHGHDDMGSFVFDAEGVRWALDLGANPYQPIENLRGTIDLWDNFSKEPTRWKVLRLSNRGHNVVTVADRPNDNFAHADFSTHEFGAVRAHAVLNLSATSARVAKSHFRTFTLERVSRVLVVEDRLEGVKPGEKVIWRLFTDARATVAADGIWLEKDGRHRLLTIDAAPSGSWRVRPANELRESWDWQLDGIVAIDFALEAPTDGQVRIQATLSPQTSPRCGADVVLPSAWGDGKKDCTGAFADAISKAAESGGRVVVPPGTWLTGPIVLRSNVELHLSRGAVVSFKAEPSAYLPAVKTTWGSVECMNYSSLVYAYGCTNVSVTGEGTLSPQMTVWKTWCCRPPAHVAAMMRLYDWSCRDVPIEERRITEVEGANMRPQLMHFNRCRGVRLEGFRIEDSPCWSVHFFLCEDVTMRRVDSRGTAWNTDGVDVDASRNVLIEDCTFDQNDDGIVIKSGRDRDGWRLATPTENVLIRNCRFKNAHTMLAIGTEISGGVRKVRMENCTADAISLGGGNLLSVKTNRRRGAFIEDVEMENCRGGRVSRVVYMNADVEYQWRKCPNPLGEHQTRVSGIRIRNVHADEADRLLDICGSEKLPFKDIVLENVTAGKLLRYADKPVRIVNAHVLQYESKEEG